MKRLKKNRSMKYIDDLNDFDADIPMDNVNINQKIAMNVIEAQIQDGDTLQSIAIKFNCKIAELKRLNKIDKDNEIYARTIIKVPMSSHSILLQTLPTVHKSGNSSPNQSYDHNKISTTLNNKSLDEKLLIASVSNSGPSTSFAGEKTINEIILNTEIKQGRIYLDSEEDDDPDETSSTTAKLLSGEFDELMPQPRTIPIKQKSDITCSSSDCDISWICLLIFILALCFAIPLIYVAYIAKHREKFHHET